MDNGEQGLGKDECCEWWKSHETQPRSCAFGDISEHWLWPDGRGSGGSCWVVGQRAEGQGACAGMSAAALAPTLTGRARQ